MYTESALYRLVQGYVSSIELGKNKGDSLNELFVRLSNLGKKDKKTNIIIKSVLSDNSCGKKIGYNSLQEVYKYLKNSRKPMTIDNTVPLHGICNEPKKDTDRSNELHITAAGTRNIRCNSRYPLRSSRSSRDHAVTSFSECNIPQRPLTDCSNQGGDKEISTLVPTVHLNNISLKEKTNSKSEFLNYFGLGPTNTRYESKKCEPSPSLNMSMLTNSTNVPVSSELGLLILEKTKHNVTEDFKLRKIQRLERYINKPHTGRNEEIDYPVTYVEKKTTGVAKRQKLKTTNIACKSLSVVIENLDLKKLQQKLRKRVKDCKRKRLKRLQAKCKKVTIVLTASDKQHVDKFLKRKRRLNI